MTTSFWEEHSNQYQQHINKVKKLRSTLNFQHNIKNYKTNPKNYFPATFLETPCDNHSSLTTVFQHAYDDIFYKHLNEVLASNTIALELEQSRAKNVITHVENFL